MATPYQPQPPSYQETNKTRAKSQDEIFMTEYVVKKIIPTFKGQSKRKQYAVVDLWSQRDIQNKFGDHFQNATVDSTVVSMPPESNYTNYIVARPHGKTEGTKKHSEIILMEQLDGLYTAFKLNTGEAPIAIFLYSHLMPCTKCSTAIVEKLSTLPYSNLPVIIAYSRPYLNSDVQTLSSIADIYCVPL